MLDLYRSLFYKMDGDLIGGTTNGIVRFDRRTSDSQPYCIGSEVCHTIRTVEKTGKRG
jgi:hypothetical protein